MANVLVGVKVTNKLRWLSEKKRAGMASYLAPPVLQQLTVEITEYYEGTIKKVEKVEKWVDVEMVTKEIEK